MKSVRNYLIGVVIIGSLAASLNLLQAQTAVVGNFNSNLSLVQAAAPDSIVQITADAQGLPLVSPGQAPRSGTFWWILPSGTAVPAPCPPQDALTAAIYQLAAGQFLVDETGGQIPAIPRRFGMQAQIAGSTTVSGLEIEADTVMSLITRVQMAAASQQMGMLSLASGMDVQSFGDTGSGGTNGVDSGSFILTHDYGTNLWLAISSVANGVVSLSLSNTVCTQSGEVYEVMSKTDLSDAAWNIETEVWAVSNQNWVAFTIPVLDRTNALFVWAQDWTGVTENGNTTPDWWFWEYFGTTALSDTTPDSQGNTLLSDYQGRTDPNIIQFTIESTNDYIVNTTTASVQLNITAGVPYYYALFVNGTTTTNWLPFTTTNLIVSLGPTDGVYDVVVGLRGLPANATQTWDDYPITLDRVAPVVKISNPALAGGSATVIKPFLQLQGLADKQLGSLSYDISNATGLFTCQPGYVTDQGFDTGKFDFTTNYFQCYDVPLTTNDNFITLRATDRAGNTTTTNFDVILDYTTATNPPVVNLFWPQDGASISGDSFTLRGTMSDETGTIAAQVVDGDGNTNAVNGLVERDGTYWIEDLPLGAGDNTVTVTATDAAGNMTTTNMTVSQSDMMLTIDSTPTGDDLWQAYGTVSGTVGDSSWGVSVNGVQAEVSDNGDGTGHWEADNVPIYGMGTATFDAVATPPGQENQSRMRAMNSGSTTPPPAILSLDVEKGPAVKVVTYYDTKSASATQSWSTSTTGARTYNANYQKNNAGQWFYGYKGTVTNTYFDDYWGPNWPFTNETVYEWSSADTNVYYDQYTEDGTTYPATPVPIGALGAYGYPVTVEMDEDAYEPPTDGNPPNYSVIHYFANNVQWNWTSSDGWKWNMNVDARTTTKLLTGGNAPIARRNLIQLQCDGVEYGRPCISPDISWPWVGVQRTPLDKSRMRALGQWVGADGNLWVSLPDNTAMDLNVSAPARHYNAWAKPIKYPVTIWASSSTTNCDISTNTPEFCVGQKVTFTLNGLPGFVDAVGRWNLPGTFVNEQWQNFTIATETGLPTFYGSINYRENDNLLNISGQNVETFCWYYDKLDAGKKVSMHVNLHMPNGQYVNVAADGKFTVYRPTIGSPQVNCSYVDLNLSPFHLTARMQWQLNANLDLSVPGVSGGILSYVQLVNGTWSYDTILGPTTNDTSGRYWLDGSDPYIATDYGPKTITDSVMNMPFSDDPGLEPGEFSFSSFAEATYNFKTYVRIQPVGAGSIPITLKRIEWSWHGRADCINGAWSLTVGNQPVINSVSPDDTFPEWPNTYPE